MIGLSVSMCIRDMVQGVVDPAEVKIIIGATRALYAEHWDEVIKSYQRHYWKADPVKAEILCRLFVLQGKIYQPRAFDLPVPVALPVYWVKSLKDVTWSEL